MAVNLVLGVLAAKHSRGGGGLAVHFTHNLLFLIISLPYSLPSTGLVTLSLKPFCFNSYLVLEMREIHM